MSDLHDLRKFVEDAYREAYLDSHVRGSIAYQIQALREKLGLNQTDFGKLVGMPQSVISRLEDMEHSGNLKTFLRIANRLGVGLQVRFCNFESILDEDVSPEGLTVENINETITRRLTEALISGVAGVPIQANSPQVTVSGSPTWQTSPLPTSPTALLLQYQGSGIRNLEKSTPTAVSPGLPPSMSL